MTVDRCRECVLGYLWSLETKGQPGQCHVCLLGPVKVRFPSLNRWPRAYRIFPQETQLLEVAHRVTRVSSEAPEVEIPKGPGEDALMALVPPTTLRTTDFQSSTKLNALVENLRRIRAQDPSFRAIVFSQFTTFLDLIQRILDRDEFPWYRLDGTMSQKQRTKAIEEFSAPGRQVKIFLISLKAGGTPNLR
jgi:DNA repair protein RAD5